MTTTDWLDERESRAWRGLHLLRGALMAHLTSDLARTTGLTEAEYALLAVVSEAPGHRLRARDAGLTLGWARSRLSHQVSRMERRGTVERQPCHGDSRGFDIVVTQKGLDVIEAAAPAHLAGVRHCFIDLLSVAELDTLTQIAARVEAHLTEEHCDAAGASLDAAEDDALA